MTTSATDPSARRGGEQHTRPGLPGAHKRDQRARLLNAMIELAAKGGSQAVTVAQISAYAGVSSATFYAQFHNKEECLLAAYQLAAERLLIVGPPAALDGDWPAAAAGTLGELAAALARDPNAGRLLFVDTLSGGPAVRHTRAAALGAFEQRVQEFLDSATPGGFVLDIPVTAVVGAMRSIVARALRTHGESELPQLAEAGLAWLLTYRVPAGCERWSTSEQALRPAPRAAAQTQRQPVNRLPRGRHGLPAGVIARSHRTRIVYATAEVTHRKGYAHATVADIVAAAGISRDVFYEHFTDKQHAFLEAQNHPTQHILEACATAYFAQEHWPARVWAMFETLLAMITANPAISHLRLVECYTAGPEAIRRAEEITRSFTFFLEEGYTTRPAARQLPPLAAQACAGAVFEIIQRDVARGDLDSLTSRLPVLTYICTAPFMGAQQAIEYLRARMLCETARRSAP